MFCEIPFYNTQHAICLIYLFVNVTDVHEK